MSSPKGSNMPPVRPAMGAYDPEAALVVVLGTPKEVNGATDQSPNFTGYTVMQASQLGGVDGAEFTRRVGLGLARPSEIFPDFERELPYSKVQGDPVAVFQFGSAEKAGLALARLEGAGANGFAIKPRGTPADMSADMDSMEKSGGKVLIVYPDRQPVSGIAQTLPDKIELMATKADLKAVIAAHEALDHSRHNPDTASLVSPVAGSLMHLHPSIRAPEWRKGREGLEKTGRVLSGMEAVKHLLEGFGSGHYRKVPLDAKDAKLRVAHEPQPILAKRSLDAALALSVDRGYEVEAARDLAKARGIPASSRAGAGIG